MGAGVGWGVGQALGSNANTLAGASLRSFAAGAATALVRGGKISITQVAVDAFGSALGDGLGATLRASLAQSQSLGQSQGSSPGFMGGGAGGGAGGSGGNGSYEPDSGPDWGTGAVAGQPALTAGDFARMDRASEALWEAQSGAWEQPGASATERAFLEAFQNPGALAPTGEGVLMAAGPGYSGGLELRDRLTLHSREDNSLFEEASALAANAMQADNRRAAWMQTQAQAASAQYAQGYGDVRDTSPAAGLMVNPETGLADFRYTSQTLNSGSTSADKLFAASGAAAAYAGEGESVFLATGVNPGSMESLRQADGAYRLEIGGPDRIAAPIGEMERLSGGYLAQRGVVKVGSGAGGLRGPGLQWGAVGDLEGIANTSGPTAIRLSTREEFRLASKNPQPNSVYEFDGIQYVTDDLARGVSSRGQLRLNAGGNRFYDDRLIGHKGIADDIAFHAGADEFGF